MSSYTKSQIEFLTALQATHNGKTTITRKELNEVASSLGYRVIPVWITSDKSRHTGRGVFAFPELSGDLKSLVVRNDTRGRPRKYANAVSNP
jgi:hypothetical protein